MARSSQAAGPGTRNAAPQTDGHPFVYNGTKKVVAVRRAPIGMCGSIATAYTRRLIAPSLGHQSSPLVGTEARQSNVLHHDAPHPHQDSHHIINSVTTRDSYLVNVDSDGRSSLVDLCVGSVHNVDVDVSPPFDFCDELLINVDSDVNNVLCYSKPITCMPAVAPHAAGEDHRGPASHTQCCRYYYSQDLLLLDTCRDPAPPQLPAFA